MASGEIPPDILDLLGFSPCDESPVGKTPVGEIPVVMTRPDLCRFLGIPESRARHLVHAGKRGQYDVAASVRAVVADLSERAARQPTSPALADAKLRLTEAAAQKTELQNARARGDLLDAHAVAREWASVLRDVRAAVLAAPSRIGSRLPHLTAYDVGEIGRELAAALSDLAEGKTDDRA